MKKCAWAPAALLALVAAGFLLYQNGWHAPSADAVFTVRPTARARPKPVLAADAFHRYQRCQPSHWRGLVLHR